MRTYRPKYRNMLYLKGFFSEQQFTFNSEFWGVLEDLKCKLYYIKYTANCSVVCQLPVLRRVHIPPKDSYDTYKGFIFRTNSESEQARRSNQSHLKKKTRIYNHQFCKHKYWFFYRRIFFFKLNSTITFLSCAREKLVYQIFLL